MPFDSQQLAIVKEFENLLRMLNTKGVISNTDMINISKRSKLRMDL